MNRSGAHGPPASGARTIAAALAYRETADPVTTCARLRVGLCSSLSWGFLRDLIRRVRAEPDAAALTFLEGATHEIVRAASRGEIDVGFIYGPPEGSTLQYEALWSEPLMVLMPDHHPLARDSDVRPEALRDQTFLVAGDLAERDLQIDLLERAIGAAPAAVLLAPVERATLSDLVSLGFGLALAPASAMGAFHPGVSVRPIAGPIAPITFHAVWRGSNRNPELERFLAVARGHAEGWRA